MPQTIIVATFEECGHVAVRDNEGDPSLGAMALTWLGKVLLCGQCGGVERKIVEVRVDPADGVVADGVGS
jgi:hypothetical protein